jgi:hypothetical protein
MTVGGWIVLVIVLVVVATIVKQIPQLRRYFRMKSM